MRRFRIIMGLGATMAAIVCSVSPAFAWIASSKEAPAVKVIKGGVITAVGIPTECPSPSVSAKIWKVISLEPIEQGPVIIPDDIKFLVNWEAGGGCTSEVAGIKAKSSLSSCTLPILPTSKNTGPVKALGMIETECIVKLPGCEIKIPAATGVAQPNGKLKENELSNRTKSVLLKTNDTGITVKAAGATCPEVGENSKAKLTGLELEVLEAKLV